MPSTPLPVTVYSPEAAIRRPRELLRGLFADLRASRELAWRLAHRDLRVQYRQSYLGYLWAFISPLANTAAWMFLNASGVIQVADTGIPYPAYVFSGTMLWQLLVESFQSPLLQLGGAKAMLAKLNFPREAIILSGFIKVLSSAGIKLVILLPALLLLGVMPDWHLILVPFAMLLLVIAGIALGLLVAPLGMLYNDIGRAIPLAAQFAMYITPVVFAMPTEGRMAKILQINPATPLILTVRAWLTGAESPMLGYFLGVCATMVVLLFIGLLLYRITLPLLIERLNS